MGSPRGYNALLVYPRFSANSFWNYRATCDAAGARYPAPPLGLITVAALLPKDWNVRLVNRNTEELSPDDLSWADVVMTGGMLPQQRDCLEVIRLAHRHRRPVVVGGPDATSSPHMYREADLLVLGEAEAIMERFLDAWNAGVRSGTFEAPKFSADVTRSPVPRFDLLKFDHYLHVGVQWSRGCPFHCEFCDIIELYGRAPRTKTSAQMLAELDELYRLGYRGHVDFVDDNLIGNKKALRAFLPDLIRWLEARGHPFEFSTEASINLADDAPLLGLMSEAGFFAIFVGIESPDPETLVHMQKKQNARRSVAESVHQIYQAGIFVNAGFIIGFDTERLPIAEAMVRCVEETAIPACMVGLLYALPNTQLTRRLEREGRLHADHDANLGPGDQCTAGLNFETVRPRRDALLDYQVTLEKVYEPAAYFGRVKRVGRALDRSRHRLKLPARRMLRDLKAFARISWRLGLKSRTARGHYWRTLADTVLHNPRALHPVVSLMALYLHFGPFAQQVIGTLRQKIEQLDRGRSPAPRLVSWSEPVALPQGGAT
jgi:radical SAM superfamily enzyme YgiQ (UPF0313 family)